LLLGVCGLAVVMQRRNPAASRLAVAGAQVIVFTHVGAILTYGAMAATPFPMADPVLSRWDRALGFDWLGWFAFVHAHPALHLVLAVAYASVSVQMLGLLVYFAYFDAARLNELLVAAVAITLVMVPLPAVGAWSQHGVGVEPWRADILGLRAHTMRTIGDTQG